MAQNSKKILIIGGTGFIGRELGVELVRRGFEITITSRRCESVRGQLPYPAKIIAWDGEKEALPAGVLEDKFAVINLAGEGVAEKRWSPERKSEIVATRTKTTSALATALASSSSKPAILIQASAIGFYGDRGDEELDESSSMGSGFLAETCLAWEESILANASRFVETRVCLFRIGLVLGSTGGALQKLNQLYASGKGACLGDGQQWLSWIHVDDVVGMMVYALSNQGMQGIVNAVAPKPVRFKEFHEALAQALGVGSWAKIPTALVGVMLGEAAALVMASTKVLPKKAINSSYRFKYPTIENALSAVFGQRLANGILYLHFKQWIPRHVHEVWKFFSDEKNLETITPDFLRFQVLSKSTPQMEKGTRLQYKLSLRGLPMHWESLIEEWEPQVKFVDSQVRGPYQLWHHEHVFSALGNGTLMEDKIQYKVPLGLLGAFAMGWFVANDVGQIFQFRSKTIAKLFNPK